ncbi:hypothetical protein [Fonticella tunisiensis]|uniref:TusA-related sulfurtransferase n=1 Tax=Fonticella tunisiensis TaxID=1096341 RepID=A0A4R7KBS3_9CLOT|nr:hypothetical protein [Fonticella tunisiensis]TDT51241.1 hypothetical protein EDD71_12022 [Fonticella tunisiensis]
MSDYRINFGKIIGPSDYSKLYDMLDILDKDDELIISIDATDATQSGGVFRVLEGNNFEVKTKGGNDDGKYNIIARRKG